MVDLILDTDGTSFLVNYRCGCTVLLCFYLEARVDEEGEGGEGRREVRRQPVGANSDLLATSEIFMAILQQVRAATTWEEVHGYWCLAWGGGVLPSCQLQGFSLVIQPIVS